MNNELHIIVYNRPRDWAVYVNGVFVASRLDTDSIQRFLDRNYSQATSVTWA